MRISLIAIAALLLIAGKADAVDDVDGSLGKLDAGKRSAMLDTIERQMADGPASRFRDVRAIDADRICGSINAKNQLGAFVGYRAFMFDSDAGILIVDTPGTPPAAQSLLDAACNSLTKDQIRKLLQPKP